MNFWFALIIGLIVGWLIHFLIDYFYWRQRRLCPDDTVLKVRSDLERAVESRNKLEIELNGRKARVGELENALSSWRSELDSLGNESKSLGLGSIFQNGELKLAKFIAGLRGRLSQPTKDFQGEINSLKTNLASKDDELKSVRADLDKTKRDLQLKINELDALQKESDTLKAETAVKPEAQAITASSTPKAAAPLKEKPVSPDEISGGLSMIWGLNGEANAELERKGIHTYNQLAATQAADVDDALTHSQKYYPNWDHPQIHGSWVEQSRFAAGGDWEGLFGYQQTSFDVANLKDDLKKLWGIGPKIETVLNNNGIYLFSQMASVPPERLTEILRSAGDRFNMSTGKLHRSWVKQARIADRGDWEELKSVTRTLSWTNVN